MLACFFLDTQSVCSSGFYVPRLSLLTYVGFSNFLIRIVRIILIAAPYPTVAPSRLCELGFGNHITRVKSP